MSDIVNSISLALPKVTSLLANSWVLGQTICYVQTYLVYFVLPSGYNLIAVLTTFKFLILRYPLRTASWSKKRAHLVCGFFWASSFILPILMLIGDKTKSNAHFDFRIYNCRCDFTDDFWKIALPITVFTFSLAPNLIIILTTVPTLQYLMTARKSARRSQERVP